MRSAPALVLTATVLASIASAQQPRRAPSSADAQPALQLTVPASRDGVKLELPPAMQGSAPSFAAQQVDLARTRKVASANEWGLPVAAANLQPSFWLTPQQPYLPNGAGLFVASEEPTTPNYTPTSDMPHGRLPVVRGHVGLRDVPATPRDWLLAECLVSGATSYSIAANLGGPSGRSTPASAPLISRDGLRPANNLITALIEPSALAKRSITVRVHQAAGTTSGSPNWTFGGCEITPIRF